MHCDDLGALIRVMRVQSGIRQRDVAKTLGVTVSYWCAVEKGKKPFPPAHFDKVMSLLSVPVECIAKGEELLRDNVNEVRIDISSSSVESAYTAVLLARKYSKLSSSDFLDIQKILERKEL